jgi:integrase/recombinase XerD
MNSTQWELHLDAYLAVQRAVGNSMVAEEKLLRDFLAHCSRSQTTSSGQAGIDWAHMAGSRFGISGEARRLTVVRGFLTFLRPLCPEPLLLPMPPRQTPRRKLPYLFSAAETAALLDRAGHLWPHGSLRPLTFRTILGLLACTGLRAGEAVRLEIIDLLVDAVPPHLVVREAKFRKSRIVPLHPTAIPPLKSYLAERQRRACSGLSDRAFLCHRGGPLDYWMLHETFQTLLRQAGIQAATGQRRPTLTSFRHSFAVNRLIAWHQEGRDVNDLLPHLSVYLGHVQPECTYWYLTATPELLRAASNRFVASGEQHENGGAQ